MGSLPFPCDLKSEVLGFFFTKPSERMLEDGNEK